MGDRPILDGWKAISAYLGRTEKTCRKWEHELGLPVYRLDGSTKAHVTAFADELDRWKEEKLKIDLSQKARGPFLLSRKPGFWIILASAAVLLAVAAAVFHWKILPLGSGPAAPEIGNSIAVIAFKNQTGDPAYDYLQEAIPNLMITNLENTGLFYVSTWERMRTILKQIGVKPGLPIDSGPAFEFCRREGIQAIAIGSFTKAGNIFSTDVKVLDVETMTILKSTNKRGTGAASILLEQVDALCREMALGLGIGKAKIDAAPMNITGITTNSLPAYDYFVKAKEAYAINAWSDVKKYSQKTLDIDPNFAMAYVYLAYANFFLGDQKALHEALEKAMALSDRTSEKDRLYLEAAYANFIKGDRQRQEALLKELIRKYPKEIFAYHYLGDLYYVKRDYVAAVDQYKKWLELDPQDTFPYIHLIMATIPLRDFKKAQEYVKMREAIAPPDTASLGFKASMYRIMGRIDIAIATQKQALEIDPKAVGTVWQLSQLYALKEDYEESIRWVDECAYRASSAGEKSATYRQRGFYRYWRGEFKDALVDLSQAENLVDEIEYWSGKAAASEWKGITYVALGEAEASRKWFDEAVRIGEKYLPAEVPVHKAHASLWLGHLAIAQGRVDQALAYLSEFESFLTNLDQRTKKELNFWRDLLRGEVLLAQESLDAALAVSQKACQPGSPFLDDSTYFRDLLARVYAKKGEVEKSISEYERLLKPDLSAEPKASEYERPEIPYGAADVVYLIHPLFHYRLGLLYEKAGEVAKAKLQYQKFLDLWKNADPGRPEIEEARIRLAGLENR